ncbi:MAG: hypothetical protein HYY46_20185 [Deltaproteobacteria bacterium]|nr:hypothetical protein [Deltaproteobacteria bacterium]
MNRLFSTFVVALLLLMIPHALLAQQTEAPVYQDGDWWRVKVGVTRPSGVAVGGPQLSGYPEYMVKVDSGRFRVFGIRGEQHNEIEAPNIVSLVAGRPEWRGELLMFPMHVGLTWSSRFPFQLPGLRQRWASAQYEVHSWETIKTVKGELEAFKIVMDVPGLPVPQKGSITARVATYYYSPKTKAIVYFREESPPKSPEAITAATLVDFNVGQ